ncbi:acyltransferase [Actinomycetaceae bacterium TAE3-ERU4]|nr:acyltransferase [Actinomycetaceae bacterium TAE3-ERU4]
MSKTQEIKSEAESVVGLRSRHLPAKKKVFRNEIQGLRAICMVQVLLFHAWHVGSPIGVDIFIMVSAYLLTGSMVRRAEAGNIPNLLDRWFHLFKRLLPPLVVTIIATVVLSIMYLPQTRWNEIITQGYYSLAYVQNWYLASQAVDYYAADHSLSSPLMHLWSMSMQGQVFILWPLLLVLCALTARALKINVRRLSVSVMALIFVASLTWTIIYRLPVPANIYFDTRSRLWEFALGSLIALLAPYLRLPSRIRLFLGWAGTGTVILFSLVSIGAYPGPAAMFPMFGAACVLAFTSSSERGSVARYLSFKPLVALGDISYALYLVHWPLMSIYLGSRQQESFARKDGILLILVSIGLAMLLTEIVDKPLRTWKWANSRILHKFIVVAASLAIGFPGIHYASVIAAPQVYGASMDKLASGERTISLAIGEEGKPSKIYDLDIVNHPGAEIFRSGYHADPLLLDAPVPTPDELPEQWAMLENYQRCTEAIPGFKGSEERCITSNWSDSKPHTAVLVGDSHIQQFLPAVAATLPEKDWNIVLYWLGGCSYEAPLAKHPKEECNPLREEIQSYLLKSKPDLVFAVSTVGHADSPDTTRTGLIPYAEELSKAGITLVALRDTPRFDYDMYDCSLRAIGEATGVSLGGCVAPLSKHLSPHRPDTEILKLKNVIEADLTEGICTGDICPGVVGNTFVYRDNNHITPQFMVTLSRFLKAPIHQARPDLLP